MSGFDNEVVYGANIDLSGSTSPSATLVTNGQLLIGATSVNVGGTHVNVGTLTSPDSSVTVGYSSPNITLQVAGGTSVGKTITGDAGGALTPTAGNWNILGSSPSSGTSPVATTGTGSTLTVNVQKSQALASADATKVGLSNFSNTDFSVAATGFVTLSTTGAAKTITGDTGGALSPTANNWNLLGSGSITTSGSGSSLTTQLTGLTNHAVLVGAGTTTMTKLGVGTNGQALLGSTGADPAFATIATNANMNTVVGAAALTLNPYNCAKWIVDPTANIGTHTTITAAIASASAGDTIVVRPGSYVESFSLKNGVNVIGLSEGVDSTASNVFISGDITLSAGGTVVLENLSLRGSTTALTVSGSSASVVYVKDCYFDCSTGATGISFTNSTTSILTLLNCTGAVSGSNKLFDSSSSGTLSFRGCVFSGGSSTANTISAGTLVVDYTKFVSPITSSGSSAVITLNYCTISRGATTLTHGSTAAGSFASKCIFDSSSSSAVSVSTGATLSLIDCEVRSSNTNAVTGAGTINYGNIDFSGTSKIINTTTQTQVNSGSFTPVLSFGGGSTGITYTTQLGKWYRSGNMVYITIDIVLSNKGSSTGSASIAGLPFTSQNDGITKELPCQIVTITQAGATNFSASNGPNTSTLTVVFWTATSGAAGAVANTAFANTTELRIQGFYFI